MTVVLIPLAGLLYFVLAKSGRVGLVLILVSVVGAVSGARKHGMSVVGPNLANPSGPLLAYEAPRSVQGLLSQAEGYLLGTVGYGGPGAVVLMAWQLRRRKFGRSQMRCAMCSYLLIGLREPRCPECGSPFDSRLLKRNGGDAQKGAD